MDLLESEALVNGLTHKRQMLKEKIASLETKRSNLPRSDKKQSGEILREILLAQTALKANRLELGLARGQFERKEQHSLWEYAVFQLYGQDGLSACRQEMQHERRRRGAQTC